MGDSRNVRRLWNSAIVMFTAVKQLRMICGLLALGIIAAHELEFGQFFFALRTPAAAACIP